MQETPSNIYMIYEGWSKSFEPGYFPLYIWVKGRP